jgi:peptide/nickel transport system permease protein
MTKYIIQRLLQVPVVLFFVSLIVFSMMHVTPGDPVELMLGDFYTAEDAETLRKTLGLDRPLHIQYLSWLWGAVRLDLGTSIYTLRPITEMLLDRAPYTIILASLSTAVALLIAFPIGIIAARRHNTIIDYLSMVVAMLGISIPNFALSVLLIMVLAVWLDLLPISGPGDPINDPFGSLPYYVMPVIALATARVALISRLLRSSLLEVLKQDYIRTARAKGLAETVVLYRHTLKNAMIPVITIVAISFAYALEGSIAIEFIFSLPGLGSLMLDALNWKDFPLIQGITFVAAIVFILANLVADVLYALVDPRIRYEG